MDVQAVAFSTEGRLLDAVYYNNMKAFRGGMTHSGDEKTGEKRGFDECIWVNFGRMPAEIKLVVFVVACHAGGHLRDVPNGRFHLLEDSNDNEVAQFRLEESEEEVDLVGVLLRDEAGGWLFRVVHKNAGDGQHFIDILEPTIGNVVREIIPSAPGRIKACFAMDKGSVVDMPKSSEIKKVWIGLGWEIGSGKVDLDVSAVLLSQTGQEVREHNAVFFGNLTAPGVQHSGDNLTGEGSGDDETITVDLEAVEPEVRQIVFIVNIYSRDQSFSDVSRPYCRILTMDGDELCRYQLTDGGDNSALCISRLLRVSENRWSFQALGQPCSGHSYKDSMPELLAMAQKRASAYQVRSLSSEAGMEAAPAAVAAGTPSPAAAPPPAPEAKSSACNLL